MLIICIFMTILLILLAILVSLLANIGTPENLKDWYTNRFRKCLGLVVLGICVVLWIMYFILK